MAPEVEQNYVKLGNLYKKATPLQDESNSQISESGNVKIKNQADWEDNHIQIAVESKRGTIFEEQNIKCSVEIKNGVPSRSFNSQKCNNTLVLH